MINLNLSELQCIRRALGDFISSKKNSVYDFSFYVDINKKINDEIYSIKNLKIMNLNNEETKSLKKVIEYMNEFELKHYEECENKDSHIYNDVIILERKIKNEKEN